MKFYNFLTIIAFLFAVQLNAKVKVGSVEKIKVVAQLPDTDEYKLNDGTVDAGYMDLGVLYKQFQVAGMPYWVSGEPIFVGTTARDDFYIELSDDEVDAIIKQENLNKEALLKLGFVETHWGIFVSLLIFAGIYIYYRRKNSCENEEVTSEENSK